jgi:hypothetical protein
VALERLKPGSDLSGLAPPFVTAQKLAGPSKEEPGTALELSERAALQIERNSFVARQGPQVGEL